MAGKDPCPMKGARFPIPLAVGAERKSSIDRRPSHPPPAGSKQSAAIVPYSPHVKGPLSTRERACPLAKYPLFHPRKGGGSLSARERISALKGCPQTVFLAAGTHEMPLEKPVVGVHLWRSGRPARKGFYALLANELSLTHRAALASRRFCGSASLSSRDAEWAFILAFERLNRRQPVSRSVAVGW